MSLKSLMLSFAVVSALYAAPSQAQIFDLEITDYGGIPGPLRTFVDNEIQKVENEINQDFPSGTPDRLMEGMANSSVMAGKGIGTDYASNMSVFLIGAGVGVGADLEKPKGTDSDFSGVGVAPGVIVGFNMGFLDSETILGMDTNRLNWYFNFMSHNLKQSLGEGDKQSDISLGMLSFGTHMRYDWIRGRGNKLLGWGGVKLNFGVEYNKTRVDFSSKISEVVDEISSTGERIQGTISGSPEASILTSTTSIPLALSTDVQILYFLTMYGGAGVDYNMGEAKGEGNLNGSESPLNCTGGVSCGTNPTIRVRPKANLDTSAKVTPFTYRAFAGVQVNLPWTRVFVQVDKSLSNELVGATAGLRFAF